MEWFLRVTGGILIAAVSGWLTWRHTNMCRVRVLVAVRGQVATVPIDPLEELIFEVTMTNTGNKLVNLKHCLFIMDGEPRQVVIDRSRFVTLPKDLPKKLDVAEEWQVAYPAESFRGYDVTGVQVEDYLGHRWYAPASNVRRAVADLK